MSTHQSPLQAGWGFLQQNLPSQLSVRIGHTNTHKNSWWQTVAPGCDNAQSLMLTMSQTLAPTKVNGLTVSPPELGESVRKLFVHARRIGGYVVRPTVSSGNQTMTLVRQPAFLPPAADTSLRSMIARGRDYLVLLPPDSVVQIGLPIAGTWSQAFGMNNLGTGIIKAVGHHMSGHGDAMATLFNFARATLGHEVTVDPSTPTGLGMATLRTKVWQPNRSI
jgi:hypothetical protein